MEHLDSPMPYRLLALDLDGTLLQHDGGIHPRDLDAIARVQRAGVKVTIATGRMFSGAREAAERIGAEGPLVCMDGSHVVASREGGALAHHGIAGDHARTLQGLVREHRSASYLFAQERIVHDDEGQGFAPHVATWSPNLELVSRTTEHPLWEHDDGVLAVLTLGPAETIGSLHQALSSELGHAVTVATFQVRRAAGMSAALIRAKGHDKGTGVRRLASHHGLDPSEIVVVGDWLNDLPMFAVAGRSFAMGHAPEEVKAKATDHLQTEGGQGGGVAEAIERAFAV